MPSCERVFQPRLRGKPVGAIKADLLCFGIGGLK